VWGEVAAVARADSLAAKRYFAHRTDSILGDPGTEFLFAGGTLLDAWPATPGEDEYAQVRDSSIETLMIGGTLDIATPAVNATRDLLPHLPNGHQVVLAELGHTTTFWNDQPNASTRLLNAFLDRGKVDTSLYRRAKVDFTPDVTHTALGKGFAATMLALPVVVALSLLLMSRRSRRRGRFSRPASFLLRSLYALVLGLGGWLGTVLVAVSWFPSVPLDSVPLAVLSIGLPVALGVYLAWVDRTKGGRTFGLSAALAGSLAGAWLGFQAGTGLLAVVTTIVGAALGANLVLIAFDIGRHPAEAVEAAPAEVVAAGA
jgi:hypothetical protein